jgi:uncharacterized membrane protein YccC
MNEKFMNFLHGAGLHLIAVALWWPAFKLAGTAMKTPNSFMAELVWLGAVFCITPTVIIVWFWINRSTKQKARKGS